MNATTLLFGAVAAVGSMATPSVLAAQLRATNPIVWTTVSGPPPAVTSGLVRVALNPPQSDWNAVTLFRSTASTPWQAKYYAVKNLTVGWVPPVPGPTAALPADARVRMQNSAVLVESRVGVLMPPPTTTVASVTQEGGSAVSMGNFESSTMAAILSALDSIVKSTPSLRELGSAVSEANTRTAPITMTRLSSGQTVLLDGGRRLVVIADRLVLMSGTQNQRSWPALTTWIMKTGDQSVSVLERIGFTK